MISKYRAQLSALALVAALSFAAPAHADEAELRAQIGQLRAQLAQQQQMLENMQHQLEEQHARQEQAPITVAPQAAPAEQTVAAAPESDTQIGGYGEINYNNYTNDGSRTQADLRRFVLSMAHRFNDRLNFNGEIEFEHAIASADDEGEAEIEQAWLSYALNDRVNLKAGLFLMPFGFLNTSHEPSSYYGVERNEIETRIIPSTWREGGIGVYGDTDFGLGWDVGVTTSFDTAKFEDAGAPLAGVHQELQLAHAQDLAVYAALNYHGVPGLTVGASVFRGNSMHDNADFKSDPSLPDFSGVNAPITLWDAHARWQAHGFDLQAVYARGSFGDASRIDAIIDSYNTANATDLPFVPRTFSGWLVQGAYTVWNRGEMSLTPFARYEDFNTQDEMPAGFAADPLNADHVTTLGLSFNLDPSVVFKTDYQWYGHSENDRLNVGVGYQF
ncbi:MAG: porin [Terricaulis sp.]